MQWYVNLRSLVIIKKFLANIKKLPIVFYIKNCYLSAARCILRYRLFFECTSSMCSRGRGELPRTTGQEGERQRSYK